MKGLQGIAASLCLAATAVSVQARAQALDASLGPARAWLQGETLTLTTGALTRTFRWNGGDLASASLSAPGLGAVALDATAADIIVPGLEAHARSGGEIKATRAAGDPVVPDRLVVTIIFRAGGMSIRRRCELIPNSPAIRCAVALKGVAPAGFANGGAASAAMLETGRLGQRAPVFRVDHLGLPGRHWRAEAVRFSAVTDHNDTLVQSDVSLLYREDQRLTGNVLVLAPQGQRRGGAQVFLVKEAPAGPDQIGFAGFDWRARVGSVEAAGSGFLESDLQDGEWRDAAAVVVGLAGPTQTELLTAVRAHMETVRPFNPARDLVVSSNTWGDRSRDGRMSEAFMLGEIEAAAALGLSHVQLDDGWQAGLSKNSASRAGQKWEDWRDEDWRPHPERFPNGLAPVVEAAKARGLGVGIWFNPSAAMDYARWEQDAAVVVGLWRAHGIRQVKIDGIQVSSATGANRLGAFFARVRAETRGEVTFNVDVTAGRRPGYFTMNSHGTVFLQNRYTDWANYYPHRTLRNLWMLGHWIPPQWFQIEFMNVWRNQDRYEPGDPLAPAAVGFDYAFATTIAAQPLAWMEVSGLPPAARATPVVRAFRALQPRLQGSRILPIGKEPDGASWTGFQAIDSEAGSGHLIVYREPLAAARGQLRTHLPPNATIRLSPGMGAPPPRTRMRTGPDGSLTLMLPAAGTFAVWRYTVL